MQNLTAFVTRSLFAAKGIHEILIKENKDKPILLFTVVGSPAYRIVSCSKNAKTKKRIIMGYAIPHDGTLIRSPRDQRTIKMVSMVAPSTHRSEPPKEPI